MVDFVKKSLEKAKVSTEANEPLSILIPKEENPSSIKAFRPISLNNVCIKLGTKVVIHGLKSIWGILISPNQRSFVPGR